MIPNPHAIVLRRTPSRTKRLTDHLREEGIDWTPFYGIDAESWGFRTVHPYQLDNPGTNYTAIPKQIGLHLSHYMLWRQAEALNLDEVTILEDDVLFLPGWKDQYRVARESVPDDWDILLLGSGLTEGYPKEIRAGNVWEVWWPQTTHAYIVRKNALETLIKTQEYSYAPIDLALIFRSYPLLRVYTVLPRMAIQHGQEIPP